MSSTFDTIAAIITETCDIEREKITPESHAIDDLGIDSLDFLDIAFAIDKAFGIKLPLEQWTQEVNAGKATTEQYFVLKNLCERIDGLVAAKGRRSDSACASNISNSSIASWRWISPTAPFRSRRSFRRRAPSLRGIFPAMR